MQEQPIFFTFGALIGIAVSVIGIVICEAIKSYCKNKKNKYPPQKGDRK